MIPFNKPYVSGNELEYVANCVARGKLSCNGYYTQLCNHWFRQRFGFKNALLTNSCTSALEMAAILCNVSEGDEIIMPSYTFVSTALAFTKFGAKVRFVDSQAEHPNMNCELIEELITPRTKAIVGVHYNGVSCDMNTICSLADKYNLMVIEDAAHAVNSTACGLRGDFVCYSFHETKNIHCGEGGLVGINLSSESERAERIWLKGTNRLEYERGEIARYEWVDTGGSYGLSELGAAFLWGQIENFEKIIQRREQQWARYYNNLTSSGIALPTEQGSSHIFYLVCPDKAHRDSLIEFLGSKEVCAPFHYQMLHATPYGSKYHDKVSLPHASRFSDCLLRLPLYYELTEQHIDEISDLVKQWVAHTQ